jgi:hypothetical protein
MNWVMNNCQVSLGIDVTHTGSGLVAAHHMANWVITSPSANISELLQTVLEVSDGTLFGFPRDAVGDEAASDISYHYMDLQRLA